jgi:hypothetical protein
MINTGFRNPFRPGAGHMPPYLAGRETEKADFRRLLEQDTILENLILTGLRGVGKTVLLETLKPIAIESGWVWLGTDLSESTSVSEDTLAIRLLTDLSSVTSTLVTITENVKEAGLTGATEEITHSLDFDELRLIWEKTPGLSSDKLKAVLEIAWDCLQPLGKRGIIFAYDEAQNLANHADRDEFPLSLLLDVFQSLQRKGLPLMLVMTGLPTLFPKLVEARTFAERMFHIITLDRLNWEDSRDAITKPINDASCPVKFRKGSVTIIYNETLGYPYFIQYMCREIYDVWVLKAEAGERMSPIPVKNIMRKLDRDFFAGRWARATDRQRDLLMVIARLDTASTEFTVQEIVEKSRVVLERPFGNSQVSQMLASLSDAGLVYKNRWGKYSLAVPLLDQFILRQVTV